MKLVSSDRQIITLGKQGASSAHPCPFCNLARIWVNSYKCAKIQNILEHFWVFQPLIHLFQLNHMLKVSTVFAQNFERNQKSRISWDNYQRPLQSVSKTSSWLFGTNTQITMKSNVSSIEAVLPIYVLCNYSSIITSHFFVKNCN